MDTETEEMYKCTKYEDGKYTWKPFMDGSSSNPEGGTAAAFYTEIIRTGPAVTVVCRGLTVGQTYGLHLYTAARRRGNRQAAWRHPSNENTGDGFTGKGYYNLVGQHYMCFQEFDQYEPVPEWMPNGGILQTEWEFVATAKTERINISLNSWLLPMLKPIGGYWDNEEYLLIGVHADKAPLLMQFRLVNGKAVGECKNTLCVGVARDDCLRIVDGSIQGLYVSIR